MPSALPKKSSRQTSQCRPECYVRLLRTEVALPSNSKNWVRTIDQVSGRRRKAQHSIRGFNSTLREQLQSAPLPFLG